MKTLDPAWRAETLLVHAGRDPARFEGAVNPPIQRASTLLIERAEDLYSGRVNTYGLHGTAVHEALGAALAALNGGAGTVLVPSGLAACTIGLLAFAEAGAEFLVADSCYGPTRRFCEGMLARLGVTTRYYDPRIGADIAALISPATKAILLESPGSLTFEVQDTPAIVAAAQARGIATIIDDTWSAGLALKPLALGVDVSAQALTKYPSGHADALLGALIARDGATLARLKRAATELGVGPGAPEDAAYVLRGLRTMPLRFAAQEKSALEVAHWLQRRADVAAVLHPALPSHPDHALWARDFTGSAGVFSFLLTGRDAAGVARFLETLRLFAMGFSWGGYESLIIPCDPQLHRTAVPWRAEGALIRVSIGLEHPADLIADLQQALSATAPS